MKRNLILLLAVLMLVFAPTMLLHAEAATIVDSGTCGENLTWTLDSDGTLTISGSGDMEDYNYWLDAPWYSRSIPILSVVLEEGVTSIGDYAFCECDYLSSITIPDSVTSIGYEAFWYCDRLEKVEITDLAAWWNIDFENNPLWYADNGLYLNGEPITSVVLPDSVTSIPDDAFHNCDSLNSITIPDSVTSIGDYAFAWCDSLSSITIPDSVTSIGDWAFASCDSLSSITIPDSVTSIGDYAFRWCDSLSSVVIGNGVTSIGYEAFFDCDSLSSITIPDSVTSIGSSAFADCDSLEGIWVTDRNPSFSNNDQGVLFNKSKTQLICVPGGLSGAYTIPNSVISIDSDAFNGCNRISSITIPGSVIFIDESVFSYCDRLSSVIIGNGVTIIGEDAFAYCDRLSSITIPDSVTIIDEDAFYECPNLTTVHYGGTEAQRADIAIVDYNWALTEATWHYECDGTNCPNPFADIAADVYYYEPVLWAVNLGITNGLSADTFGPDATCTRGQIVTFLWRACGSPEPTNYENPFSDVSWDDYFYEAVLWAVENGITSGMGDGTFAPGAPCTRGQVATFLWRAEGQPYSYGENIFSDISYGAYYYDAVLWAVENGITNGMGEGIFAPDATCTRGQIVTFLYRAM